MDNGTKFPLPFVIPVMPSPDDWVPLLNSAYETGVYSNSGRLATLAETKIASRFGANFSSYLCSSNTSGLIATFLALGLSGKKIALSNFTFSATFLAIHRAGAIPCLVDVDLHSAELSVSSLRRVFASEPEIKAVVVTRAFGANRNQEELIEFANSKKIVLIFDSAAAFPSSDQPLIFSTTNVEVYSFHATKSLGIGEGGCVVGGRDTIEKIRQAGNFGLSASKEHFSDGMNCKLDEFGAARLLARLETIDQGMNQRKLFAAEIHSIVMRYPGLVTDFWNAYCSWSLFPVKFRDSTSLLSFQERISTLVVTRRYYRPAISEGYRGNMEYIMPAPLTNSIELADTVLCLPVYEKIEKQTQETLLQAFEEVFKSLSLGN